MSKSEYMFAKKERIPQPRPPPPLNVFSQSETPFHFPRENQSASQVLQEELGVSGPHHWIP